MTNGILTKMRQGLKSFRPSEQIANYILNNPEEARTCRLLKWLKVELVKQVLLDFVKLLD